MHILHEHVGSNGNRSQHTLDIGHWCLCALVPAVVSLA